MKKTLLKKLTAGLLLAVSAFSLVGCNSNEKSKDSKEKEVKVEKADFETQTITLDNVTFEIPKDWSEITAPNTQSGYTSYAPANADVTVGTSSVNIITSAQKVTLKDLKANSSEFEKQIKSAFSSVDDFKFSDFKAPSGDVFVIEYNYSGAGKTASFSQYMVILDGYVATITASNMNDNVSPSPKEVAKHMANTIKMK